MSTYKKIKEEESKISLVTSLHNAFLEIAEFERGERKLKVTKVTLPSIDVKKLREDMGMSQKEFSVLYGVSTGTLRNWEQGVRDPEGPARVLLSLINNDPQSIAKQIVKIRRHSRPQAATA